jgi:C_GCAxxG_C_C family probable redox protein
MINNRIMMNRIDRAVESFKSGFSCSQAVCYVFAEDLGLDRETALRVSGGFGGGMGHTGQTCGAVTGAVIAIGLKYGKVDADDNRAKEITYEKVQELKRRFCELHGSILCEDLLGMAISDPVGLAKAREAGLFKERCPVFVRDAAAILEEIL